MESVGDWFGSISSLYTCFIHCRRLNNILKNVGQWLGAKLGNHSLRRFWIPRPNKYSDKKTLNKEQVI